MRRNGISPRERSGSSSPPAGSNISGDIQPEMLEPQIEIATTPSLEFSEARTQLSQPALVRRGRGARFQPFHHGLRHPSSRRLVAGAPHRSAALRQGHARPADARQPQRAVRHACPCGGAGSRHARRHHEPHPALSAAASGALHLLALLAGAAHGPSRLSARRLSRAAAHRASRTCSRTSRITSATSIPSWLPAPSRIPAMSGG